MDMTDAKMGIGIGGYRWGLNVKTLFGKGFEGFYPMKRERTEDCYWSLKHFKGESYVELLYTDDAPQYRRCSKMLGIPWDHSEPGQPRNNAIAEALGGSKQDAIRACSVTGGLPGCFWPFVGTAVTVLRNARKHEDGVSAHFERFGREFDGRCIAPGAMVWFRPAITKYKVAKTMPRLQPGVFLGYEQQQGCAWRGIYYVADLESFRNLHLHQAAPARLFTHCAHATKVIRVPDEDHWIFPLKKQYDFDNGVGDIAGLNRVMYGGPHIKECDKIVERKEDDKPADEETGDVHPLSRATDLSGRMMDPIEGAIGYRRNAAGRRVLVDSFGSEIRKGSRRPIGRISTEDWIKMDRKAQDAFAEKYKGDKAKSVADRVADLKESSGSGFVRVPTVADIRDDGSIADGEESDGRPDPPTSFPDGKARRVADAKVKRDREKRAIKSQTKAAPPGPSGSVGDSGGASSSKDGAAKPAAAAAEAPGSSDSVVGEWQNIEPT